MGTSAREAAWACKELFDELGIETTPMTTGSKGYHVFGRLLPTESMTRTAHKLAAILLHRHPALLTNEFLRENRGGRVLIDWMRNMGPRHRRRAVVAAGPHRRPRRDTDHVG